MKLYLYVSVVEVCCNGNRIVLHFSFSRRGLLKNYFKQFKISNLRNKQFLPTDIPIKDILHFLFRPTVKLEVILESQFTTRMLMRLSTENGS